MSNKIQSIPSACMLCSNSFDGNKVSNQHLKEHMKGDHDVFFNEDLITAINMLDKDTLAEIISEFDRSYAMIMNTENTADNIVDCLLCRSRINFGKDGKLKFINHFKGEHEIVSNHDLMMAVTFLDKDTQNDIVSRSKEDLEQKNVSSNKVSNDDIEMLLKDSEDEDDPAEIANFNKIQSKSSPIESFKCKLCAKSFIHSANLSRHMLTHAEKIQYNCEVCKKSFINENYLTHHMGTVHRNNVVTKSPEINQKAAQPNLKKVPSNQNSSQIKQKRVQSKSKDFSHKNINLTKDEEAVATTCPVCNRFYSSIELFAKHIFSGVHGLDLTLSDEMKIKLEKIFEEQNCESFESEEDVENLDDMYETSSSPVKFPRTSGEIKPISGEIKPKSRNSRTVASPNETHQPSRVISKSVPQTISHPVPTYQSEKVQTLIKSRKLQISKKPSTNPVEASSPQMTKSNAPKALEITKKPSSNPPDSGSPKITKSKSENMPKPKEPKPSPKQKDNKSRVNEAPNAKRKSEDDISEIVKQPYVQKRIKQNLKDINFDYDSDENDEWKEKDQNKKAKGKKPTDEDFEMKLDESPSMRVLPKRGARKLQSLKEVDSDGD